MKESLWNGDMHIHTNLSRCSKPEIFPATYLPYAEQEKLTVLGFSNHIYYDQDLKIDGLEHQKGAAVAYARRIRAQIDEAQKNTSVKLYMGAEVDTFVGRAPSLLPEETEEDFDYVLLAASHILNYPWYYDAAEWSDPDKLRTLILKRFFYCCELDYPVPAALCHPLYPICSRREQEVIEGITEAQLKECFTCARENKKGIEIHACLYRPGTALNADGISPLYLHMLSVAKECGCKFHFGADAHTPAAFIGVHEKLRQAALSIGITRDDMWEI